MVLTEQEESLVKTVRALNPDQARRILLWASALGDLSQGEPFDWSDVWTDQDIADASAAGLASFEQRESERT